MLLVALLIVDIGEVFTDALQGVVEWLSCVSRAHNLLKSVDRDEKDNLIERATGSLNT
jgi:hypothetical protein